MEPAGFDFIRMTNDRERVTILDALELCRKHFVKEPKAIFWSSIYVNGKINFEGDFSSLDRLVKEFVNEIYPCETKYILSYGFLVNPIGTKSGQPFHVDYTGSDSSIYIPLTPLTPENSMQYINVPLKKSPVHVDPDPAKNGSDGFGTTAEMLDAEGLPILEVRQLISRPWTLLNMRPNTAHRGIPNTSGFDRVLFYITIDDHLHEMAEPVTYQFSNDVFGPA